MKSLLILIIFCFSASFIFAQTSDSSQFYLQKGKEETGAKRYAVAANNFDKAIQFNPNNVEAYVENGKADLEMRKITAALVNFEKAYQLQQSNETAKELSTLYFNNRQFQKAIDFSQKCNCPEADRTMGISYYELEDYGKAQSHLQKALNANDTDAEAAYNLGRTYIELENEKDAIPQYLKAISIEPSRNTWVYELGLLYYSHSDYKNALKYISQAGSDSTLSKTNDYNENLGFAQLFTGDAENGLKTLNTVLAKKPNNKELLNNIANAMYETKHYDDALNYFSKLLELNPKDATSLYMAGMAFQKKGDIEKGKKICDKAIEMDPSLAKNRQKKDLPVGL
jgi:tetratricopeptide (TPR) repeat protein